jgi:hypothetical protein
MAMAVEVEMRVKRPQTKDWWQLPEARRGKKEIFAWGL